MLVTKALPLQTRIRLWTACVQPVLLYGLSALCLDANSASRLRAQVANQLRIVARSPGHVTKESNHQLHDRLGVPDVMQHLFSLVEKHVRQARRGLGDLQPCRVQARWSDLVASASAIAAPITQQTSQLTEVTLMQCNPTACPGCGVMYGSLHAVRTHIGKSHSDQSRALTKGSYAAGSYRTNDFVCHAKQGKPECRYCNKRFSSWRSFMGHFHQRSCSVYFCSAPPAIDSGTTPTQSAPAYGVLARGSPVESVPDAAASLLAFPADEILLALRPAVQQAVHRTFATCCLTSFAQRFCGVTALNVDTSVLIPCA